MTVVINTCYGEFKISDYIKEKLNLKPDVVDTCYRMDKNLIEAIKQYGSTICSGKSSMLGLVEIIDDVTDWVLEESNGFEWIECVIDGHLYRREGEIRNVA